MNTKKILTISWMLIIAGIAYIGLNFSALFQEETTSQQIPSGLTPPEKQPIEIITLPEEEEKSFTQYIRKGEEYFNNEFYENATELYIEASELNPSSSSTLVKLGNAYLKSNHPKKAEKAFTEAEKINPSSLAIKLAIVQSQLNQQHIEIARNTLEQLDQEDTDVKFLSAILHVLYKDFDGAKKIFEELEAKDFLAHYETYSYYTEGDPLFLQTLLAKQLTEIDQYSSAIPLLLDVVSKQTNYRDAWIALGFSYLSIGDIENAIGSLTQAEALDPENPDTLFYLGLAYFANNEITNAIYYIESSDTKGFEPKDQLNVKLGDLYVLKNKYEKAAQKYETVLATNTKNIEIFTRLAWLYIDKLNTPEKALELANTAITHHTEDPMSYNLKGWALTALGEYEEARIYLSKSLSRDTQFEAAILNLGWLYEQQDQEDLAKEYYKRAYILGSGNSISARAAFRFNKITLE